MPQNQDTRAVLRRRPDFLHPARLTAKDPLFPKATANALVPTRRECAERRKELLRVPANADLLGACQRSPGAGSCGRLPPQSVKIRAIRGSRPARPFPSLLGVLCVLCVRHSLRVFRALCHEGPEFSHAKVAKERLQPVGSELRAAPMALRYAPSNWSVWPETDFLPRKNIATSLGVP
jgi:hypothetical protein